MLLSIWAQKPISVGDMSSVSKQAVVTHFQDKNQLRCTSKVLKVLTITETARLKSSSLQQCWKMAVWMLLSATESKWSSKQYRTALSIRWKSLVHISMSLWAGLSHTTLNQRTYLIGLSLRISLSREGIITLALLYYTKIERDKIRLRIRICLRQSIMLKHISHSRLNVVAYQGMRRFSICQRAQKRTHH